MASVYERYNTKGEITSWAYAVSNYPFPPIRKAGFKTEKDAEKAAILVEYDVKKNKASQGKLNNKYERLPFHLEFAIWVHKNKTKLEDTTKKSYATTKNKIEDFFQEQLLMHTTPEKYQQFLDTQSKNSISTNEKLHTRISEFASYAFSKGKVVENFTLDAVVKGQTKPKKDIEKKYLTIPEYISLTKQLLVVKTLNLQLKTMILFAVSTGVRFGELCGICWEDIDFDKQTIRIHRQWDYIKGSGFLGLKDSSLNKGMDNNVKERTVPLNKHLMDQLLFYKNSRYNIVNAQNRIFYKINCNAQVISNTTFNKNLRSFLSTLNIREITAHGLRHSFATFQVYKKIEKEYLQYLMGHVDFRTTEKYYIHYHEEMYINEANKFLQDNNNFDYGW